MVHLGTVGEAEVSEKCGGGRVFIYASVTALRSRLPPFEWERGCLDQQNTVIFSDKVIGHTASQNIPGGSHFFQKKANYPEMAVQSHASPVPDGPRCSSMLLSLCIQLPDRQMKAQKQTCPAECDPKPYSTNSTV